jgi:CO/xanthine dehydrogenase Mo-binding subunit
VVVEREVRLERLWCAADCGLTINPDGARNQLEGGMVQAASMALKEEVRLGGAGVASLSWADYPILRFSEVPEIDVDLIGVPDDPPLGVGEATMGPTAGAIGNAVAHALGVRMRALPMTRARIEASLLA